MNCVGLSSLCCAYCGENLVEKNRSVSNDVIACKTGDIGENNSVDSTAVNDIWDDIRTTVIAVAYSWLAEFILLFVCLYCSAVAWCGKLNAIACASETCARIPRSV